MTHIQCTVLCKSIQNHNNFTFCRIKTTNINTDQVFNNGASVHRLHAYSLMVVGADLQPPAAIGLEIDRHTSSFQAPGNAE